MSLIKVLKPCMKLFLNETVISDNFASKYNVSDVLPSTRLSDLWFRKMRFQVSATLLPPEKKSREGNVFTGVSLFTGGGTSHASWNRSHGRVPHHLDIRPGDPAPPPPPPATVPTSSGGH